ncbi:hypothetical protein P689_12240 [Candidatus Riesia pediculischaeffi PTSU]|uniref:Uncharacterized protein n=1 Tax=Candidatus Riesia pediculischaeffi PTSU TaxID=1401651 RepID=A0A0C1S9D4_9ENTR|nr:hypothetical protein P689_12240 [Candidatus Riesia pediculischaeffi PTSU]
MIDNLLFIEHFQIFLFVFIKILNPISKRGINDLSINS